MEANAGASGLAGLPSDRQGRPPLDLDGNLAGRWRNALADADRDPRGDVFPGAERRAARRTATRCPWVQGPGRRAGRAGAQSEPIETETAAQAIEHTWAAAGKRAGCRGELKSVAGGDLADP